MKISATEVGTAEAALVFLDEEGALADWLLLEADEIIVRGEAGEPLPATAATVLVVPGEQVAIHWLELAGGLALAQATAAARLLLADASADTGARLHAAVGRPEQGLTPVALVPVEQMARWLATAAAAGLDPTLMVPSNMLLTPPATGFVRRDRAALADYRGLAAAFSLEPELAQIVIGGVEAETVDPERFEAGLPTILAAPPLNLRQGAFARNRPWRVDSAPLRRLGWLALLFILLTLAVQLVLILRYTFAADALEEEASALGVARSEGVDRDFAAAASPLFDAVRATPNVELTRLDYRPDGALTATLQADSPAVLAALAHRLEANGAEAEQGPPRNAGGRLTADFTVRAR